MSKRCSECGLTKDVTDFYKNSASPDGFRANCKACHNGKIGNDGIHQQAVIKEVALSDGDHPDPHDNPFDTHLVTYKYEQGGRMLNSIGRCDICGSNDVLFESHVIGDVNYTVNLCNYCSLRSTIREVLYIKVKNRLAAIVLIQ